MLTWKPLGAGAELYDPDRSGPQELAEHVFYAFRLTEQHGTFELTEYERRSGAGYRAMGLKRFETRSSAVEYADGVIAATQV